MGKPEKRKKSDDSVSQNNSVNSETENLEASLSLDQDNLDNLKNLPKRKGLNKQQLNQTIHSLCAIVLKQQEQINQLLNNQPTIVPATQPSTTPSFASIVKPKPPALDESNLVQVKLASDEMEQRAKRANNIGIPESNEDATEETRQAEAKHEVTKVLHTIGITNTTIETFRFKVSKDKTKPSLIKVVLPDTDSKIEVYKNVKKLRKISDLKNVYVNPDLTPIQQAIRKKLLEEREKLNKVLASKNSDEIWVIRNSQLQKVKKRTPEGLKDA
jgi:hypothetical protein